MGWNHRCPGNLLVLTHRGVERGRAVRRVSEATRWHPRQSPWQPRWATGSRVRNISRGTFTGATGAVTAVACVPLDGRVVGVTGGVDGTVRVWDLVTSTSVGEPLRGHTDSVTAVACTHVSSRPIAVTSGVDGTVRVWDLTSHTAIGDLPPVTSTR
jgi:WD40 repeat protein